MFPELSANQVETVVRELRQVLLQQGLPKVTAA